MTLRINIDGIPPSWNVIARETELARAQLSHAREREGLWFYGAVFLFAVICLAAMIARVLGLLEPSEAWVVLADASMGALAAWLLAKFGRHLPGALFALGVFFTGLLSIAVPGQLGILCAFVALVASYLSALALDKAIRDQRDSALLQLHHLRELDPEREYSDCRDLADVAMRDPQVRHYLEQVKLEGRLPLVAEWYHIRDTLRR